MPLRDHFRPPVSKRSSWEGFHGGWPMRIVEELSPRLPVGFVAEPRVHLGSLDAEFPEQYAYEVLVFDLERDRRLVAANKPAPSGLPFVPTSSISHITCIKFDPMPLEKETQFPFVAPLQRAWPIFKSTTQGGDLRSSPLRFALF